MNHLHASRGVVAIALGTSLLSVLAVPAQAQESSSPRYKAQVPASIQTPEHVDTRILGALEFVNGMPSEATVEKSYDFLDVARGAEAFLSGISATSTYAVLDGYQKLGVRLGDIALTEDLLDARALFLTANTTTLYLLTEINVGKEPIVLDVPAGGVIGVVNDAMQRFVTDVGLTGPNQGKGGKYLFLHSSHKGPVPDGYIPVRTQSYRNMCFLRVLVNEGDLAGAARFARAKFRLYPLSSATHPPEQRFVNVSGKQMNTIPANDFSFYEELNAVVQSEPADLFEPQLTGVFASIGIKKGRPFSPDARMKKLLTEAVAIGNATARAIAFAPRRESFPLIFPDRQWRDFTASYDFMNNGEMTLDSRTLWYYIAIGVSPSMGTPPVGQGSVYPMLFRDSKGNYLEGDKTYSVTLPGPVPARNFWALTVYDSQTRSLLETDQRSAGLDSNSGPKAGPNGSYTVWFGPRAPTGKESNWIQTMPGTKYFILLRLFGPLEPWFNKTWKPGDLEQVVD